ncbi:flagellar protein FlgN [Clostridium brassicae]|uniref:Flagellar protein FlgN n=1 Tax=Clostridium brassicae TaxID=2999072 RepID=A0ABT4DB54_9CLOT|nr:flagellar protein FlgN [Clostridium brassicae]MCY6959544.1 flagellar protein FlgN [Clostridium brassicae]
MSLEFTVCSSQLKENMKKQSEALKGLLKGLEEQHEYIVKNDVFKMESCVEKIQKHNQNIANLELERRSILKEELKQKTMSGLIEEIDDKDLEKTFRDIQKLINEVKLQKDTNELLIRQGMVFTNKMLMILNPDRQAKTYNGYGKIR